MFFRLILTSSLCLVLLVFARTAAGQFRPFEKYRFEDGGYSVVGVFEHFSDHPVQKKVDEFYTDDVTVLNALKKSWAFSKPQHEYACGYHYLISVLRNGEVLDDFAINLECHELALGDRSFYFDWRKLADFAGRLKPLFHRQNEFNSVAQAREFWKTAHSDKNFVYAWHPAWLEFEGEFQILVKCSDAIPDCRVKGDDTLPGLRETITKAYPGEPFDLKVSGGRSNDYLFITIKCDQSLEKRLDLSDRWGKQAPGRWQAYPLTLSSYWKRLPETE